MIVGGRRLRLVHFTPLRYPGGKGRLASFIKRVVESNGLSDGEYVEPYAGGAAVALELLFHEYVSKIHINDISRPLYAFWKSVLDQTEELMRLVHDAKITVRNWDRQKSIFTHQNDHDDLELGFATFFLNRTNRSGILNGGIIGGRDQSGPWKIDARFNAQGLNFRIQSIAKLRSRIRVYREDARTFLAKRVSKLPEKALIYLDPPYYRKGQALYYDFYEIEDHQKIAALVTQRIRRQQWIVSYDDAPEIRAMYSGYRRISYSIDYSARDARKGREVMFFSDAIRIPRFCTAMKNSQSAHRGSKSHQSTRD